MDLDTLLVTSSPSSPVRLTTRLGTPIPTESACTPSAQSLAADKKRRSRFPGWIIRRELDLTYNCYGMALANRRAGIYVEDTILERILNEDGYRRIDTNLSTGDLAIYRCSAWGIRHISVVVCGQTLMSDAVDLTRIQSSNQVRVLSKWGDDSGEYYHMLLDHPIEADSITVAFDTDRPLTT